MRCMDIMNTLSSNPLRGRSYTSKPKAGGFTLAEVTISLAVASVGLLSILLLLPAGLTNYRDAVDTSVQTQIAQKLETDATQTPFAELVGSTGMNQLPIRFFDSRGEEVSTVDQAVYHARVVAQTPTAIPGGSSDDLATITIDVAKNPGNQTIPVDEKTGGFAMSGTDIPVTRFGTYLARREK